MHSTHTYDSDTATPWYKQLKKRKHIATNNTTSNYNQMNVSNTYTPSNNNMQLLDMYAENTDGLDFYPE